MRFRSLPPLALFTTVVGASLYSFSSPLFLTFVDSSFFQDPVFFNKFEDQDFVYKTSIKEDLEGTKNYFFNNSFNLYWKHQSDEKQSVVGNGFLLNILYPPEHPKGDPIRYSYRPKYYSQGEELIFLVGTSFSFVKQLFTGITNWSSEVNNTNNTNNTPPDLQSKSNSGSSSFNFYFSHSYPDKDLRTGDYEQDYLYKLDSEDYYKTNEFLLNKSHYFKVECKDVSVVYAAVDLQINKKLIDFPLRNSTLVQQELKNIHKQDPQWADNIDGYKFATDFAVLQIKLKIKDLRGPFLEYLKKLYNKEGKIAKVPRTSISVTDGKTNPIYLAGWSSLSDYEQQIHKFDNLFIEAKAKTNGSGINSMTPSSIDASNFSTNLDLNICESFESDKCSSSSSYEHTNLEFFPNDVDGVLFVSFQVKNKSTGFVYPKKKSVAYNGFKSGGATANNTETLSYYNLNQQEKNQKLKNFLAAKPKGMAKWKELEIKYGYFPFYNLRDHFKRVYYDPSNSGVINSSTPLDIFSLNGQKYLNISHQINIPNLDMSRSKGMVALMKDPDKKENVMVGMYEGKKEWTNPFSLNSKSVGKIMLFTSPWRYDLFTKGNKLSKPTLSDALQNHKSQSQPLLDQLIYRNQFQTGLL